LPASREIIPQIPQFTQITGFHKSEIICVICVICGFLIIYAPYHQNLVTRR
jgi:hypothetical protein